MITNWCGRLSLGGSHDPFTQTGIQYRPNPGHDRMEQGKNGGEIMPAPKNFDWPELYKLFIESGQTISNFTYSRGTTPIRFRKVVVKEGLVTQEQLKEIEAARFAKGKKQRQVKAIHARRRRKLGLLNDTCSRCQALIDQITAEFGVPGRDNMCGLCAEEKSK